MDSFFVILLITNIIYLIVVIWLIKLFVRMAEDVHSMKEFLVNKPAVSETQIKSQGKTVVESQRIQMQKQKIPEDSSLLKEFQKECRPFYNSSNHIEEFRRNITPLVNKYNAKANEAGYDYDFNEIIENVWNHLIKEA